MGKPASIGLAASIAILAACGVSPFRRVSTFHTPEPGRTLAFGTVAYEPPLGDAALSDRRYRDTLLGLTLGTEPLAGFNHHLVRGLDARILVPDDTQTFVFDAPSGPFYLRSISHYLGSQMGSSWGRPVRELWYLHCLGIALVAAEPGDRVVYVGEIVCHHEGEIPVRTSVEDHRSLTPLPSAVVGDGGPIVTRLAQVLEGG